MQSHQSWFGEGPELAILRMLGLFDRPADEKALGVLLKSPAIPGLTEPLAEVERLGSELIELSTRHNFAFFLAGGEILRGWARNVSGDTEEGLAWIASGVEGWKATGAILAVPYYLGLKAEALYLGNRTSEAFEAI